MEGRIMASFGSGKEAGSCEHYNVTCIHILCRIMPQQTVFRHNGQVICPVTQGVQDKYSIRAECVIASPVFRV